jgi:spermidine/putrescine transport system substrate-binding protein
MDNTKRYERLRERYMNGGIDRRSFLGLIGAAGLAYGVQTPFARGALAAAEQVRFDGWGGVVSEAFRKHAFDPYTEKTGIKVVDGTFGGGDEYLSRVKASQPGEYNIAHLSGVFDYARYHISASLRR